MTRPAATPEEPGSDEEHEDATAFLGDWLARASARGHEPQPVERPAPRPAPEPDPPVAPEQVVEEEAAEKEAVPDAPPRDPSSDQEPAADPAPHPEQTRHQGSFDFGAFYSSLDTRSESAAAAPTDETAAAVAEVAPPAEATEADAAEADTAADDPADPRTASRPTAGAHAARRGLFRRRARSRPTPAPRPTTDDPGRSDPPPTRPDPSVAETPAVEPVLDDLPPAPPPDYSSFYERLLGAGPGTTTPEPEPTTVEPEPEPEPEPPPVAAPADPEPAPAPDPVAVDPGPEHWAADAFTARTPFTAPLDEPEPEPTAQPLRHLRSSKITPAPSATPPPPPAVPQVVEFPRPRGPRIVLTMLLLVTGTAAAVAIWQAAQTEAGYDVGIAGALTALTLVFWWGLTTSPMQQVAVRGGILEIEDRESHFTFDLRNPATRVDVEGTPGSRDWRVTIYRHRLPPYVLTRRTVDSERFSEVLEHYRTMARKAEEQRLQQRPR